MNKSFENVIGREGVGEGFVAFIAMAPRNSGILRRLSSLVRGSLNNISKLLLLLLLLRQQRHSATLSTPRRSVIIIYRINEKQTKLAFRKR